jgi:hypothetical protein
MSYCSYMEHICKPPQPGDGQFPGLPHPDQMMWWCDECDRAWEAHPTFDLAENVESYNWLRIPRRDREQGPENV